MKKSVLILYCMVMAICSCAQDSISVIYRHSYRFCEEVPGKSEELCVLDMTNSMSHFYSKDFERSSDLTDSLSRRGMSAAEVISAKKKEGLNTSTTSTNVYKNYPEEGKITVTEYLAGMYKYEEDMPRLHWILEEGDTVIAGYRCFRASTIYRGRTWMVCYAPDIALNDGPWKLCGLPGLILYALDSQGYFKYDCVGIKAGLSKPIRLRGGRYNQCDAQQMAKLLLLKGKDLDELFYRATGTRIQHYDTNGKPMKLDMPLTICLKERF